MYELKSGVGANPEALPKIYKLLRKGVSKRYKSATQLIKQIIKCRQEMENA